MFLKTKRKFTAMDNICLICNEKIQIDQNGNSRGEWHCFCSHCGNYFADLEVRRNIEGERDIDFQLKAPVLAHERFLQGRDGYHLTWNDTISKVCIEGVTFVANYPQTYPEKLDRVLLILAKHADFSPREWTYRDTDNRIFFIIDNNTAYEERKILFNILHDQGYVNWKEEVTFFSISLTLEGIRKALKLHEKAETNPNAFIAMWFMPSLDTFAEALKKAIQQAGYIPHIVKDEPHNDYIMEKILNLIREARFVVADLTCEPETLDPNGPKGGVRGGVYFEAGFALGQRSQVILTCRDDYEAKARVHFDLAQRNTIFWTQEPDGKITANKKDFVALLKEHIIFTVGKGPLFKD